MIWVSDELSTRYTVVLTMPLPIVDILDTLTYSDSDGKAIDSFTSKNGPYERIPGYTTKETKAIYQEILGVLCDIGHLGDMFQVSKPAC